jgi:hypothetical protein
MAGGPDTLPDVSVGVFATSAYRKPSLPYGRFRRSELFPLLARINYHVQKWIRAKYRQLRRARWAGRARGVISSCR